MTKPKLEPEPEAPRQAGRRGGPAERARRSQRFVLLLFLIATVLLAIVIAPFAGAFFAAAVLAAIAQPVQHWMTRRLGGRARLAAGLLTLSLLLLVVLPAGVTSALLVREGLEVAEWVSETVERSGPEGLLEPLPGPLQKLGRRVLKSLPAGLLPTSEADRGAPPAEGAAEPAASEERGAADPAALEEAAAADPAPPEEGSASGMASGIGDAALVAGGAVRGVIDFLVHGGLLVIALFFFLSEGHRLVDYFVELAPLEPKRTHELLTSFRGVAVGVFASTLATVGAQTLVALVGYLVVGVPALPLVIAATFVAAFVPAVGGASVTILMGIVVWASGRTGAGVFLTLWGLLAVSMIDNVVKPLAAKSHARLPASLVFFAMLCGLSAFGPMGLVAGPLAVVFFQVSARMLRDDRAAGSA